MLIIKYYFLLFLPYLLLASSLLLFACTGKVTDDIEAVVVNNKLNTLSLSQLDKLSNDASAHWITPQLFLLAKTEANVKYTLVNVGRKPFSSVPLTSVTLPKVVDSEFPHLADFQAYKVGLSAAQVKAWLKQRLVVVALDKNQQIQSVSLVQTGAVIDALYTKGDNDADEVTDLGASITDEGVSFKLWAPTAQQVNILLFNDELIPMTTPSIAMVENTHTGVWSIVGDSSLDGVYYQYQVTVYHPQTQKVTKLITTDPYSLSLSINSKYSQVVDLNSPSTQPKNWQNHFVPIVNNVEDNVFYEVHIRDFSADDSSLSNVEFRGKYEAFSEQDSYGIKHLKSLKKAGLNNIHLLPTFDIGTVNETKNKAIDVNDSMMKVCIIAPHAEICQGQYNKAQSLKSLLQNYDVKGRKAEQVVSELRQLDNYNWGYDPYHYTVPEGSYAINPQGKNRLIEFRKMVQSLHGLGFRVIMDVVYNHTLSSGLASKSVLDKVVPNYYHRLNLFSGEIEHSTCCDNTATERVMMAKLMTDSLVVWARDYKIDGFRFDLMGHQPKAVMLTARKAVRKVDNDTYFYGEGWNFGEVANNSHFVQASQLELGGSEIGTYSDRLRDAVRGTGNNTRDSQGLGNGLLMQPNEKKSKDQVRQEYLLRMDQLRVGLAGNLSAFPLKNSDGQLVLGKDIPYGDQPTGYALDPADTINYVSKHDNQTLWDNSQYRLAFDISTDDRVRMHLQSLSFILFAQGIPFLHMGSEFMRSKAFLRDSYDYGDWFNRVDFSKQNNYYNIGLPPADKDQANWPLIKAVLKGHQGRDHVTAKHIKFSAKVFEEMLELRMSSPLFRLTTAKDIMSKISFLNTGTNQQAGLLVMKLDDTQGESVDKKNQALIVIFNMSTKPQHFSYQGASKYRLHPIQQNSVDTIVKHSYTDENAFFIPALSSVVFAK